LSDPCNEEIYHSVSEAQDTVEESLPELDICDPAQFCGRRLKLVDR